GAAARRLHALGTGRVGDLPDLLPLLSPGRQGGPADALRRPGAGGAGVGGAPVPGHPRLAHAAGGPGGAPGPGDGLPGAARPARRPRPPGAVGAAGLVVRLADRGSRVLDAVPALSLAVTPG